MYRYLKLRAKQKSLARMHTRRAINFLRRYGSCSTDFKRGPEKSSRKQIPAGKGPFGLVDPTVAVVRV